MKTAAASKNVFRDSASKTDVAGVNRRMAPVCCGAEGCPCRVQFLIDPDKGTGLCEAHFASDQRVWTRVTTILRDPKSRKLVKALDALAASSHLDRTVTWPLICDVQRAGIEFGMSEETLKMQQMRGWVNGRPQDFLEPARAYEYRISRAHISTVLERATASSTIQRTARERALEWTEKALAEIAGRGKKLMDEQTV